MAKIFEVMSSDISVAGESDFVASNVVDEVAVTVPGASGLPFDNANGDEWFEEGDNVVVTNFWVNIPFGFGQGTGRAQMGVAWEDALGNFSTIVEFAGNSVVTLPNVCGLELPPSGLFVRTPAAGGKWRLSLTSLALNVSQVNLPTALNGDTVKVQYHIQLYHTLPLTAAP